MIIFHLISHYFLSFSSVAEKLKVGLAVDPEEFADVTIYFSGKDLFVLEPFHQ
jgi:hypothetical protein